MLDAYIMKRFNDRAKNYKIIFSPDKCKKNIASKKNISGNELR